VDVVVDGRWVQGFPPLMPRQVESRIEAGDVEKVLAAARAGELFVRIDREDGERVLVTNLWLDPHDRTRVTFILQSP